MPREMKDSGVEWIGNIPSAWEISQIGTLYTERKTKVSDVDYPPLSVTMKGIVPQLATAAKTDAHDDRKLVCVGDFAINSRSDRRGSCGISAYDGSVSLINTILTPRKSMNPRYYNWLFHTASFADEFYSWGHGIVDDLWTTNWQDMKRIQIPVPTLDEQEAIADFLDKQCAEIDAVIAKTKATIEEYKKLEQSVITEAVTKGIRGDRPMKDSGIELIGNIPVEWSMTKLGGATISMRNGYVGPTRDLFFETGIRYIQSLHIKNGTIDFDRHPYYVSEEWAEDHPKIKANDILIVQTGDIGQVGIVEEKYNDCNCHALIIATPNTDIVIPNYLKFYLMSFSGKELMLSFKTGALLPHLNAGKIKFTPVVVPTLNEQQEIANYLDEKVVEIDILIDKKITLLEEMETYKKSVIYEHVTGKKEIASESTQTVALIYPYFPSVLATNKPRFAQAILMSKILDSNVSNMGRVKLEKMLFTIEHSLGFDFDTEYSREAAGPLDSSIYECERVISRANKWFYINSSKYGVSYKPQGDMSKYKKYYEQYFSEYNEEIERIINVFRNYSLDQAEIVATLYGAWNDFIIDNKEFTDEDIVNDVLNNWNDSKKRFSKDIWFRAIESMRKNNLVPKGYGKHTVTNPNS